MFYVYLMLMKERTTKDKKDQHGMGHLIVEEQVKRLGGMVEYYEDKMFCAHVYLPM